MQKIVDLFVNPKDSLSDGGLGEKAILVQFSYSSFSSISVQVQSCAVAA